MYKGIIAQKTTSLPVDLKLMAEFISLVQEPDGEIPWSNKGKTDQWDHVESAMGLTVGGFTQEARRAYEWSARTQMDDGSWWSYYENGLPQKDAYKDTNMTAYIAVGVLHYFITTGDYQFLGSMWACVQKAIDYVIDLQGKNGEIFWAKRKDNSIAKRALLTGSSSIYMSLVCALKIASLLDKEKPHWKTSSILLRNAITQKPALFDSSKSRFSMDWYYPVLSGAVTGKDAARRIEKGWNDFVKPDWGVLCVSDRPWATMAETAELAITLGAMGDMKKAGTIFKMLLDKQYGDGSFWTGVTFPDREIYTTEKTTWTSAAVLLSADMVYGLTPASRFFSHRPGNFFSV
jgi:MMP endo-(1,4)-3-O-methyl-alpha-D-mannosidase